MVYVRKKRIYGNEYWYACKSKRTGKSVKQETVLYIGPCRALTKGEAQNIAKKKIKSK